jgi:hypothetical protein
MSEAFVASVDLNTSQFHIVDLSTAAHKVTIGAAAGGYGIVQNKPLAGEHATVAIHGASKCIAGAAIAVGDYITSAASGYASVVTSGGSAKKVIGRAVTAAASGSVFTVEIDRFVSAATLAI